MATGFPAGMKVEVEFTAGTFTDVTTQVDTSVQVQMHFGRTTPYGSPDKATLSLRLKNADGRFTPQRQDSIYYPNVEPMKRIQVSWTISATKYPRYIGYITGWPPSRENGVRGYVDIQAVCLLDRLSRIKLLTTIRQEQTFDVPSLLWPLSDAQGSTSAAESSGNLGLPLVIADAGDAAVVFGADGPGSGDGTSVQFAPTATNAGQYLVAPVVGAFAAYTVECWVNAGTVLPAWASGIGASESIVGLAGKTALIYLANGFPSFQDSGVGTINSAAAIVDGGWHHLAVTVTGSGGTATMYVDGASVGTKTAGSGASITTLTVGESANPATYSPFRFQGRVGDVALYPAALSSARVAAHAAAGVGYYGDTTGTRISRLLALAGLTSAQWNLDAGKAIVGTYPQGGTTILQYIQDMATTEGGGAAAYTTPDGKLRFADRTYRKPAAPVLTIHAGNDMTNSAYQPTYDALTLVNSANISRSAESGVLSTQAYMNSASQTLYGSFTQDLTSYATTDLDALNNGQQIVAENGYPGFRFPQIGASLLTAVNNLYVAVASVQIGSRIRLSNIPAGLTPATQADAIVEGWTETFANDAYTIVYDTSPADNPPRFLWDDTSYGRWQCDGQTLNTTITSAGTTVIIATAASKPTFSTSSGDYPLKIQIDEEIITLNTVPGGSSSPQTFTGVTRGQVGTPQAAHTSGAVINLYPPAAWAL